MAKSKFPTADGQSLAYRDPSNVNTGTTRRGRPGQYTGEDAFVGGYDRNRNSYSWLDPVYSAADGDYGRINEAADELEISNIDEKREARDIVAYLNDKADADANKADRSQDKDKPKNTPKELITEQPADEEMDPFIAAKVDSVNEYAAALDDGRYFNYRENDDNPMPQVDYKDYFDPSDSEEIADIDSESNSLLSKYIDRILQDNKYV